MLWYIIFLETPHLLQDLVALFELTAWCVLGARCLSQIWVWILANLLTGSMALDKLPNSSEHPFPLLAVRVKWNNTCKSRAWHIISTQKGLAFYCNYTEPDFVEYGLFSPWYKALWEYFFSLHRKHSRNA